MSGVEKITIALTAEMAAMVHGAVERGEYASSSEVIREALRLWKLEQAMRNYKLAELRRLWQEGIDSGPAAPFDMKEMKAHFRGKLEQEKR